MSEINNLTDADAIAKMKEIAELVNTCMLCTKLTASPFNTRPMSLSKVDDTGKCWFMSSSESDKNMEIQQNDHVQLIFSDPSGSRYMSVYGEADIFTDPKTIEEAWTPGAAAWFTDGRETAGLSVIIVHPLHAHYWDIKDSKMINLLKISVATIAGKPFDDGVEGRLTVKTK